MGKKKKKKNQNIVFVTEKNERLYIKFTDKTPDLDYSRLNKKLFEANLIDEYGLPFGKYFKMETYATIKDIEDLGIKVIFEENKL